MTFIPHPDPNFEAVLSIRLTLEARGVDHDAPATRQFLAWLHAVSVFLGVDMPTIANFMLDRELNPERRTPPLTDGQLQSTVNLLIESVASVKPVMFCDDWSDAMQYLSRVAKLIVTQLPRHPEALVTVTARSRGVS